MLLLHLVVEELLLWDHLLHVLGLSLGRDPVISMGLLWNRISSRKEGYVLIVALLGAAVWQQGCGHLLLLEGRLLVGHHLVILFENVCVWSPVVFVYAHPRCSTHD